MQKFYWEMNEDEAKRFIREQGASGWEQKVETESAMAQTDDTILPNPWTEEHFSEDQQEMLVSHSPEWAKRLMREAEEDERRHKS
ncbi:MAG: hypothetical protein ACLFTB_06720 [Desulfovibrionales bacterium]